jgi:hypothetical protein
MIDRSLAVHGTLAVAAVAAAALAWRNPASVRDVGDIEVIAGKADELTEIGWSDADADVSVRRAGAEVQVQVASKKAKPKPPAKPGAPVAPAPSASEPPPLPRTYPGTETARELFGRVAPFAAVRDLGAATPEQLQSFGLDKPPAHLRLRFGARTHEIDVGNATFGASSVYVRPAGGDVYLVKAGLLSDLKSGANGLTERSLVTLKREDIERVSIKGPAKARDVVQRHADDRAKAYFADPAEPDKKLTQVTNWLDRLMRTRMVDFVDEKPKGAPAVVVELLGANGPLGSVSLWPVGEDNAVAVSTSFGAPVTLSKGSADTLLKDVEAVLGEAP